MHHDQRLKLLHTFSMFPVGNESGGVARGGAYTTEAQVAQRGAAQFVGQKQVLCPHERAPILLRLACAQVRPALTGDQIFSGEIGRTLMKYGRSDGPASLVWCVV